MTQYNESDIFHELLCVVQNKPGRYFPTKNEPDKVYNFFLDLEKAYSYVAGSRIHVFADEQDWAIVFESNQYDAHGLDAQISLNYIGNCIQYPIQNLPKYRIISNTHWIPLIDFEEFYRIEVKDDNGNEIENGQLLTKNISEIKVKDTLVPWNYTNTDFETSGITLRKRHNPQRMIDFPALVRFLDQTKPELMSASESELRTCIIPQNIPKLITIHDFHYTSLYRKPFIPSEHETYKLLAQIILNQDASMWKPTLVANNHWKNWTSGNL